MENVIDLTDMTPHDCDTCDEPTKYVVGRTFDVDGPGVAGVMYDCENHECRRLLEAKVRFFMRREIWEKNI